MSFCSRGQADLIRRVAEYVRLHGRNVSRGGDRRLTAPNSGIDLDYINQQEARVRYVKRDAARYSYIPGYADHPSKRDIVYSYGFVTRLRSEGWEAVFDANETRVHVFGDLTKMTRDLTMILMADDLEAA